MSQMQITVNERIWKLKIMTTTENEVYRAESMNRPLQLCTNAFKVVSTILTRKRLPTPHVMKHFERRGRYNGVVHGRRRRRSGRGGGNGVCIRCSSWWVSGDTCLMVVKW